MPDRKWFGREPALIIQGVATLLGAAIAFGAPGLNDTLAAAIVGALTAFAAFWTAVHVQPVAPSVAAGLISALVGLLSATHVFEVTQQQAGAVQLAVAAAVMLWSRGQQEPVNAVAAASR